MTKILNKVMDNEQKKMETQFQEAQKTSKIKFESLIPNMWEIFNIAKLLDEAIHYMYGDPDKGESPWEECIFYDSPNLGILFTPYEETKKLKRKNPKLKDFKKKILRNRKQLIEEWDIELAELPKELKKTVDSSIEMCFIWLEDANSIVLEHSDTKKESDQRWIKNALIGSQKLGIIGQKLLKLQKVLSSKK
jgi:hypothetical protein